MITVGNKCTYIRQGEFQVALLHLKMLSASDLTHWDRVTHICVNKQTNIGSDNGLSPGRRQAIIWTNVGILLIGTLGTNFSEILIEIRIFSFKKMGLKSVVCEMALSRPECVNVINTHEVSRYSNISSGLLNGVIWSTKMTRNQ